MSTWQIFADAGNTFRWEISDQRFLIEEPNDALAPQHFPPQRLPSMADLLLQGCSRLMEDRSGKTENTPAFRTGLGKSVGVKQSSISRALAILGDGDDGFIDTGRLGDGENNFGFLNTMSWTSSGKETKILKSMFQTGMEKTTDTAHSLFQTGSGKTVSISSAGLVRAKTLLGLEESCDPENFEGFEEQKKHLTSDEPFGWQSSSISYAKGCPINTPSSGDSKFPISKLDTNFNSLICEPKEVIPDIVQCASKPPPIKFQTAGGRSISVSSDALQRARSLLGDPELGAFSNEMNAADHVFSVFRDGECKASSSNKENDTSTPFRHPETTGNDQSSSKNFTSPLRSNICQKQPSFRSGSIGQGNNLIKKFDAEANEKGNKPCNEFSCQGYPVKKKPHAATLGLLEHGIVSKINMPEGSSSGLLVDISNTDMAVRDNKWNPGEKRRLGRSTVSPFKRPRISKFVTPINRNSSVISNGLQPLATNESSHKRRVSTHYPFQVARLCMKEYIREAPSCQSKPENFPDHIWRMNPDTAEKYKFSDEFGSDCIGAEEFHHMLAQSGASVQYMSKEWVANHYKWIVWKLSSYERCYPAKFSGKLLTVSNVLEELKYRYEREVNHGHRSAIKRILEGDVPPSTRMVLCISFASVNCDLEVGHQTISSSGAEDGASAKIELTDGWYSIYGLLDALLSNKLAVGKLFVGQKLRIWGAGLCGWVGPVSPLESSRTTSLQLHINGTYRAHWADRLGFCKGGGLPLAFRSIKSTGGLVPSTLVGVLRIYPLLYRERLSDGGFVVRSERTEAKMSQLYDQRCSVVQEGIVSEFQRDNKDLHAVDDNDSEEGAKILKMLETAAEPEMLMAEMTSEQLTSFASYQTMRQSDMQKTLEQALMAAGLSGREVTPLLRVRVAGLTSKNCLRKYLPQTGLITIWNPTEKQQLELLEGQAYAVAGLMPLSSDSSTLYLQARGPSTKWLPLSPLATEKFEPFFSPRKSVLLSNLGEVPLSSEFDVAAFVIYVGEAYTTARHKKQWVFVSDGSSCDSLSSEPSGSILAISFCAPFSGSEKFAPVNHTLAGSMVGFCNLIKRAKDQVNNLWVAEATENSTYSLTFDHMQCSHLKDAAASAQKWANISSMTINNLKMRVLSVISNSGT